VTCNKEHAETRQEARGYVYNTLIHDASFVGDGGRFSSPVADWFVIGGRWSGELSRETWAKAVTKEIALREEKEGIQVWGAFYADKKTTERQERLKAEIEALYQKAIPKHYCNKGLVYTRNTYGEFGYEDDAVIVTEELYNIFLKPYEGLDEKFIYPLEPEYFDLDGDGVHPRFIQTKWLVVADYHS